MLAIAEVVLVNSIIVMIGCFFIFSMSTSNTETNLMSDACFSVKILTGHMLEICNFPLHGCKILSFVPGKSDNCNRVDEMHLTAIISPHTDMLYVHLLRSAFVFATVALVYLQQESRIF